MKLKLFFVLIVSLFCINTNAQKLLINDLVKIYSLKDDQMDTYLSLKGFEFYKVRQSDYSNGITYICRLSGNDCEYLSKSKFYDGDKLLTYEVFDQKSYIALKQSAIRFGFVYLKSENYEGKLRFTYKKGKLFLRIWAIGGDDQTYTSHEFTISTVDY